MINFKEMSGFECNSTGGLHIKIKLLSSNHLILTHGSTISSWDKQDMQFFVNKLQEVINKMEE